MTEQLKQAAQAALDALVWEFGSEFDLYSPQTKKAIEGLRRALTTSQPAAQEHLLYEDGSPGPVAKPAAQATPEPEWETSPKDGEQWETTPRQATQQAAGEPVGRCLTEEEQARTTLRDPVVWFGGAPRGKTLFTHPAPAVPEGFALVPIKSDDAILRPFYNCPPDELGLAWDAAMRVAQVRLAAAQAKGGA